jgi:hypothetical protein
MTRLPEVPAGTRLLPDARLYQVWKAGKSMELEASFSALESAVEHIGWMLRNDPMQRVQLDILPPVEVKAPCPVCGANLMVGLHTARGILAGELRVWHDAKNHWVAPSAAANQPGHYQGQTL